MTSLGWGLEAGFDGPVFGVDEVGRGPWAGPVVAGAACLEASSVPAGLADSKRLSAAARQRVHARLDPARIALGEASVAEIDRLGIANATDLAMARAVAALAALRGPPAIVLVDGNRLPPLPFAARAIIGGDASVASIAAAAIAAKVHRDRLMEALALDHPGYGWARNRGYGTADHAAALARLGPTPAHRRSFAPVARVVAALSLSGHTARDGSPHSGADSRGCVPPAADSISEEPVTNP